MMNQYLGISLVIIVASLCIGILSTIVSENIFKQIEAHKKRVSDIRWKEFGKFVFKFLDNYGDKVDKVLEQAKMEKTRNSVEEIRKDIEEHREELEKSGVL